MDVELTAPFLFCTEYTLVSGGCQFIPTVSASHHRMGKSRKHHPLPFIPGTFIFSCRCIGLWPPTGRAATARLDERRFHRPC